ncbi:MAG: flagellar brake protein [Azoarcus sp.]|jgi:c-di-GMP-binding flagellar brake protein YcgR|nr:flagellar brake protein [Azoarcus sp.]
MLEEQIDEKPLASLREDGLEEFFLRGRRQICRLLQELISNHSLVSVHLLPGELSFLSTVITLSEDEEWVFLDSSPNEVIHRHSLQAEHLLCVTQLNKIRIQFRLPNATEVLVDGRPALVAPVPKEILRLQRRDTFRLQVPLSLELKCILPAQDDEPSGNRKPNWEKKGIEVSVVDISAGGLSMEIPFSKTAPVVGDQIIGCCLKLPKDLISINLEIRNQGRHILANGKEMLRLGCSYVSLPIQDANRIQRYIYQVERELRTFVKT